MDSAFYAACTALMSRTEALDTIANNLANSSTGGYRARHTTFSSVLAGYGQTLGTDLNEATNSYGVLGASRLDLAPAALVQTGSELDVGIAGPAFLTVQTASGPAYTRSGSLKISPQGQLVTASGDAVMGEQGVISIPRGSAVSISADGTISAGGGVVGKLKLVEFPDSAKLQSMGSTYYTAEAKDAVPSTKSQIEQGMLEGSNVNPVASVIELINAQRAAEGMRHALTMIDSEMDKTAAQDIPRLA